jgi:hypothetical protein
VAPHSRQVSEVDGLPTTLLTCVKNSNSKHEPAVDSDVKYVKSKDLTKISHSIFGRLNGTFETRDNVLNILGHESVDSASKLDNVDILANIICDNEKIVSQSEDSKCEADPQQMIEVRFRHAGTDVDEGKQVKPQDAYSEDLVKQAAEPASPWQSHYTKNTGERVLEFSKDELSVFDVGVPLVANCINYDPCGFEGYNLRRRNVVPLGRSRDNYRRNLTGDCNNDIVEATSVSSRCQVKSLQSTSRKTDTQKLEIYAAEK